MAGDEGLEGRFVAPVDVKPQESLIRHPRGQAMSQDELVTRVWGGPPTSNIVEVYIGYLRRKLARPGSPAPIETVRSVGYRLRAPR